MYWLYQLAPMIEQKQGYKFLLFLTVIVAVPSNVSFYFIAGPAFEGMSGVIYGYMGYIWARMEYSREEGYFIDEGLIKFFVVWYVLCWFLTAFLWKVANSIHGIGAFMGILLGILLSKPWRYHYFRKKENVYQLLLVVALLIGGILTDRLFYGH
jgi:GlpG protein